jgi:hypothetical protein
MKVHCTVCGDAGSVVRPRDRIAIETFKLDMTDGLSYRFVRESCPFQHVSQSSPSKLHNNEQLNDGA